MKVWGGYAAIKYASVLDVRRALAFAPQFSIDPNVIRNRTDPYIAYFNPLLNSGMEISSSDSKCPVDIILDPLQENDREHLENIRRRVSCRVISVPHAGHALQKGTTFVH